MAPHPPRAAGPQCGSTTAWNHSTLQVIVKQKILVLFMEIGGGLLLAMSDDIVHIALCLIRCTFDQGRADRYSNYGLWLLLGILL